MQRSQHKMTKHPSIPCHQASNLKLHLIAEITLSSRPGIVKQSYFSSMFAREKAFQVKRVKNLSLGHHHLDKLLIVDLPVAIHVSLPDHLIHFLICQLLAQVGHHVPQLQTHDDTLSCSPARIAQRTRKLQRAERTEHKNTIDTMHIRLTFVFLKPQLNGSVAERKLICTAMNSLSRSEPPASGCQGFPPQQQR